MNKYEKIRLVGRGAYGTVFLCDRLEDSKRVILKEIPVDQMSVDERQASVNEAEVLSMLDHPNIVGYYESFLEDKTMTIVMEYVQGGTLYDFLKQRDGVLLEEHEVLHYFGQMVYTLQYVHTKLILHRDLKSQNILLNSNKTVVKIGDFGISKVLTTKSKAYTILLLHFLLLSNTPWYSTNVIIKVLLILCVYNQKSDIWALGCLLYELMTLKRPFDATNLPAIVMKIMKGAYDPVPDIYSSDLKKLLMSMLHLDPNHRPSAAEIMCQPFMINVIFKLYVDIGSIPCTSGLKSTVSGTNFANSNACSDSFFSSGIMKTSVTKLDENLNVWFFQNSSSDANIFPPAPKGHIKCVSLGSNHKIGLTSSGLLISWQMASPFIAVEDEHSNQKFIKSPSYTSNIIDERFVVNITYVASGNDFTICQSDNGVIFSFGKASSGCLGHALNKDITEPKIIEALFSHNIVSVACGSQHALAVSDEDKVFSWGRDTHGCLGLGETELQILPKEVDFPSKEHKPEKVFCGPDCSFVISTEKVLFACGNNRYNKLALDSDEGVQLDESHTFIQIRSDPLHSSKIMSVSAGKSHTIILCDNNEIYSVGSNEFFQLGWGQIGSNHSMPGIIEQLKGLKFLQISCCDYFSLCITDDHTLYCWGKCPKSFNAKEEICYVESPSHFSEKEVLYVSCDSENCLILTKDKYNC